MKAIQVTSSVGNEYGHDVDVTIIRALAELHVAGQTNYRVITDGAGLSFLEVGAGDNIGGYRDKILKLCTVATWQPFERGGKQYIPTYAYDRLVVAGLGCLVEAETGNHRTSKEQASA